MVHTPLILFTQDAAKSQTFCKLDILRKFRARFYQYILPNFTDMAVSSRDPVRFVVSASYAIPLILFARSAAESQLFYKLNISR